MSLRKKFEQAAKDGHAVNKAADLANIDKKLQAFVAKLPAKLDRLIAARAAGGEPGEALAIIKCKHLGPHEFNKADFDALNGFRALVDFCKSPDNDVDLFIKVESRTTPDEGSNTSTVNYEAQLYIAVNPGIGFEGSQLVFSGNTYNGYKDTRHDATVLAGTPAPVAAPETPAPATEKIAVMSPVKLTVPQAA
ncbi:MAG: hypothetical protein ACAH80_17260 [Alphaproteobacteria bacterium]